jgi:hypothetical protein
MFETREYNKYSIFLGTYAANVAVTGNIQINGKRRNLYSKKVVRKYRIIIIK